MLVAAFRTVPTRAPCLSRSNVYRSKKVRFAFEAYYTLNSQSTDSSNGNPSTMSKAVRRSVLNATATPADASGISLSKKKKIFGQAASSRGSYIGRKRGQQSSTMKKKLTSLTTLNEVYWVID